MFRPARARRRPGSGRGPRLAPDGPAGEGDCRRDVPAPRRDAARPRSRRQHRAADRPGRAGRRRHRAARVAQRRDPGLRPRSPAGHHRDRQHALAPRSFERQPPPEGGASGGEGLHHPRGRCGDRTGRVPGPQPRRRARRGRPIRTSRRSAARRRRSSSRRWPRPSRCGADVPVERSGDQVAGRTAARAACHDRRGHRRGRLDLRHRDEGGRARRPGHAAGAVLRDGVPGPVAGGPRRGLGDPVRVWRCPDTARR